MRLFKLKLNYFIILAVSLLLIFLHYLGVLSPVENLAIKILSPVQTQIYSIAVKVNETFFSETCTQAQLEAQIKEFKSETERLTLDNVQLEILRDENRLLKDQLNLVASFDYEYVSCRVITKRYDIGSNTLILDCGSNQNVATGLAAISSGGIIIGKIIDVESAFSRLLLITSQDSRVGATILNDERTTGVIVGSREGSLRMEYIPQSSQVATGDIIVTSALENRIPKNLAVGKVGVIESPANSLFKTAAVEPIIDYESIELVTIFIIPIL